MKLNEICEVYSGYALKSFNDEEDGFPVIKIGNILIDGTLNLDECQYTTDSVNEKYYSNKGDIYIALSGATTGKIGIMDADERYVVNQRVGIVRKKSDKIPQEYIKYFLLRQTDRILQEAAGCAQPNISPKQIAEYSVPKISKDKMFEVCSVLDKTKRIIHMRKTELTALDNLIKARFVEMFGDRYVNDKKWNTTKLGESISFNNGKAHEQVVDENGDYILVTSRAIASDFEDVRRTNTLLFPLHKNDIVMVMSDVPNGKALAKCQLIDSDDKYTLNQRICSFDNYEYNTIFLLHLLNRHPYFLSFNDGNGQTNLRKNDILECELIVPPFELQNQFADCVKQVNKSKAAVQKALTETQLLFDSLMQQYFG